MTGEKWVDQAIAHEAGHILVGLAFELPIQGMSIEATPVGDRIKLGHFITESKEPPDEQIPQLPEWLIDRLKLSLAAGLAGNMFSGLGAENESLQNDRLKLNRLGTESLEDVAERALKILKDNPVIFGRLVQAIEERFVKVMKDLHLMSGRHRLLNEQELKVICGVKDECS